FYLVTVAAYFILRRRRPEEFRSFRIPLAPAAAAVFGVAAVGVLASYVAQDGSALATTGNVAKFFGGTTMLGVILILVGLVLYWAQGRSNARKAARARGPTVPRRVLK
ncbi:MAG: hypothetical protein LC620_07490, partial [Halobacteriales archaeon]|nr:hypothetical protein [Halobacteriales archaeon]